MTGTVYADSFSYAEEYSQQLLYKVVLMDQTLRASLVVTIDAYFFHCILTKEIPRKDLIHIDKVFFTCWGC